MTKTIEHFGIVKSVDDARVSVLIQQSSACGACAAKAMCASAERKEKVIDVQTPQASQFVVGQQVIVVGRLSDGLRAAWIAYALPLLILIMVLVGVYVATGKEVVAALCGLASLVPYFLLLTFLRGRLQRRFSFQVRPCSTETNQI